MKFLLLLLFSLSASHAADEPGFKNGYPDNDTVTQVRNDQVFQRAVQAYRFWYPTVSAEGIFNGFRDLGVNDNEAIGYLQASPIGLAFTANMDTPYAVAALDVKDGAMVVELPPGAFIGLANDHHQNWIQDMGIPGPDAGKGGKHLILPPNYKGEIPADYHVGRATSNKVLIALRAIPQNGNMKEAMEMITRVKIYPFSTSANPKLLRFVNLTSRKMDGTLLKWENNMEFWNKLHKVIDEEPILQEFQPMYGFLSGLGIEKGKKFAPDNKMRSLLEQAAKEGRRQMLVSAFANWRPDRIVWKDRRWEWVGLVSENGNFMTQSGLDLEARDRWFSQAIIASPAMFRRTEGAGSLYWLGLRDDKGEYLDGGKTYKLSVPMPVPAKLFWSVTVYDNETRSLIQTDQNNAALRSLVELKNSPTMGTVDVYFGPKQIAGKEGKWIKTIPGKGWFAYFRIYGPGDAAFKGTWRPGDFEEVKTTDQTASNP
ncbi:DUF1254 domain-containing protein [Peredibacter starrii]|uniref:DUF1254 domain-containing protein n=1 Tax=Peredibacter starrii TaxID=28202 RepID=A0AAX4HNR6_9BACT|nr:DUF1254 domain-containing protein [Peredibacter starrii]WPU64835.1 DUF1254 domain-containing protein [Peredibacter starrii]